MDLPRSRSSTAPATRASVAAGAVQDRRPRLRPAIRRLAARPPAVVRQQLVEDPPPRAVVRPRPARQPQPAAVAERPRAREPERVLRRDRWASPQSPVRRSPRGPRRRARNLAAWSGAAPKATPVRRKRARHRHQQASDDRPAAIRPSASARHARAAGHTTSHRTGQGRSWFRRRPRRTRSRSPQSEGSRRRRRRRRSRSSRRHRRDAPHHHQRRRPRRIRAGGSRPHRTRREEVNPPAQKRRRTPMALVSCSDLTTSSDRRRFCTSPADSRTWQTTTRMRRLKERHGHHRL